MLGKCAYGSYKHEQAERALDDYLVPVMSSDDMERIALNISELYYPEVLTRETWLDSNVSASRLGLTILEVPLGGTGKHRGQVYFKDSEYFYIEKASEKIKNQMLFRFLII